MPKQSAGLLLYREGPRGLEVFLVHPGGPFWAKKDEGAWSIPKGEFDELEDPLAAARREFEEETGFTPVGEPVPLEPLRQAGGKRVHVWALQQDVDPARLRSDTFSMEWPPKSGKYPEFPEVDRGEWFLLAEASRRILKGQAGFLAQLQARLG
jgi:predicted NUDIX family NTP pyrophosphohydrolase